MDTRQDDLRRDLDAAVQTRKELGKEYESEIVASFLARIEQRLDARSGEPPARPQPQQPPRGNHFKVQVLSLIFGVPLTGIAAGTCGLTGLVVCWAGIVGVNVSAAIADRQLGRHRPTLGEWA